MRQTLREALTSAIKARDTVAVAALRSALAAIDGAEAVDVGPAGPVVASHPDVAGSVGGLGSADVPRRVLTDDDVVRLVRAEVAERRTAAAEYDRLGRGDRADRLTGRGRRPRAPPDLRPDRRRVGPSA